MGRVQANVNVVAWHIGTACGPMGLRVSIVNDIYINFVSTKRRIGLQFHNENI